MTVFDLVLFLALFGMFIIGFAQGITRRLLGIGAILFSFVLAAQLRTPFGGYLAQQWTSISPEYSYMVAFGAVFAAAAIAISFIIQISYRPAPLLYRYPVLDEILGGVLGVLEGLIIFMAFLIITDPYFAGAGKGGTGPAGEFGLIRTIHGFLDDSVSAQVFRENIIPGFLTAFAFLFPQSIVDFFRGTRAP